ncbi:MAG: MlaD family protein [Puniceicoccales bacterium]|jgi:paraquat-inducible protein B|nr:MlaD family protein [Puniceicoccales bacterium]
MSRNASTPLIGAFVLGAVLLVAITIGLFGAGTFSANKATFICYFEDSENGLETGAPVKCKGVTIGKVSRVLLHSRFQSDDDNAVPVVLEIDGNLLSARGVTEYFSGLADAPSAQEKSLRARLQQQSLLTGLLYIELDFNPGSPAKYHKKDPAAGPVEIPTLASNLGALVRAVTQTVEQLSHIQFAAMGEKADRILAQIENGFAAIDFKTLNKNLLELTANANALLNDPQTRKLSENLNATLASAQHFAVHLEGRVDPLAADIATTTAEARRTLEQLNRVAENLQKISHPQTGVSPQLNETLRQISSAADAVRTLAAYLERRPETLLRGKPAANSPFPAE